MIYLMIVFAMFIGVLIGLAMSKPIGLSTPTIKIPPHEFAIHHYNLNRYGKDDSLQERLKSVMVAMCYNNAMQWDSR